MTKIKKSKKTKETSVEPVVKPEVVEEPVKEPVEESMSAKELRKIYAVAKARNPELYDLKNKDASLERKLKVLKGE